jgi:iduronate 2-sulfatase
VPLIISAPGMKQRGEQTDSIAEMIDFYPTLAELVGLQAPAYLSGVSLAGVLDDTGATPRTDALTLKSSGYSLRTARYRYNEWGADGAGGAELYDHQTDPQEMNNLVGDAEHADTVARLSKRIRARIAEARTAPVGVEQMADPEKKAKPKKKNRRKDKEK